jgi:hypothetical protein
MSKAAHYYRLSADQQNAAGQFRYGYCLEFGVGVEIDLREAARYYQLSTAQHYAAAQYNYGHCLEYGGTPFVNRECFPFPAPQADSIRLYQVAADQMDPEASLELALYHQYRGMATPDLDDAAAYYKQAHCTAKSDLPLNAFRCLRACGKTRAALRIRQATTKRRAAAIPHQTYSISSVDVLDSCLRSRPPRGELWVANYLAEPYDSEAGRVIGRGGFSTVTVGTSSGVQGAVAVKSIPREAYDQELFFREIEALVHLNHPCVLQIYGWSAREEFHLAQIHTEMAEHGSLEAVLEKVNWGSGLPFWNATGKAVVICGIVLGMAYVHRKGYIHRDLKPSDILINAEGRALISDFGMSRRGDDDHTLTCDGGTVYYAPPELFSEDTVITPKVDVFSFGLVLYEILTGHPVFPVSQSAFVVIDVIRSGKMPSIPDRCGHLMQNLIPRCWLRNPELRPSFEDILRELSEADFAIVPDGDSTSVGAYVQGVLAWEAARGD